MTPFNALRYTCACCKSFRLVRRVFPGNFPFLLLALFVSVPALAVEGTDVSTDEMYSDDVTLTTFDGQPLDINLDGFVDLAVGVNDGALASRYYLGNGDGTFAATPVLLDNRAASEILAADVNGDTFIDLIQGARDLHSRLYLGNGAGGVGNPFDILDTNRVLAVAVGDLDGDGDLDLVTGNGQQGGEPGTTPLQVNRFYLNGLVPDGTPAFTGSDIAADMDDTRSIALADMDGDGDLDVITGNDETTPGSNEIYMNRFIPSGTVSFADDDLFFGPPDDQTSKILVGDLNSDGQPDIVVLNFVSDLSPGINRFFLNDTAANGTFTLGEAIDVSPDTNSSSGGALADFDGDGDLDIAVSNVLGGTTARNRLYLNQWIESGETEVTFIGSDISTDEHQTRELAAGDIDNDGDIDIIAGNQPLDLDKDGVIDVPGRDRVYLNNGTEAPFTNAEIPSFTSTPVTEATVDVAYVYDVTATDPESEPVTIAAPTLPAWLTFTDNGDGTATLTGTPTASEVGDHAVSLRVSDGSNSADQDFTITVNEAAAVNTPPEFTSTAVTSATEGEAYSYAVTASDADGDALTLTATAPGWLTFTDNGDGTATLSGTPGAADTGEHEVSLQASDGTDTAGQDFTVTVKAAASSPPPPPPPGSDTDSGGGGSFGALFLLAFAGLAAALRCRRAA